MLNKVPGVLEDAKSSLDVFPSPFLPFREPLLGLINWCSYGFDKTVDARVDSIGQKEILLNSSFPME